jgi:hypothetical protein
MLYYIVSQQHVVLTVLLNNMKNLPKKYNNANTASALFLIFIIVEVNFISYKALPTDTP